MPEWLLSIIVGVVVVGLVAALHRADMKRVEELEKWKRDKEAFDYKFRHDEYATTINRINSELWPLMRQTTAMQEQIARLERKLFVGWGK